MVATNAQSIFGAISGAVMPSCTVGLTGAAVSVTSQGMNSQSDCNSFLGQTTNGGTWYVYSGGQQPAGAVICQVTVNADTLTVRDSGLANVYGTAICNNLLGQSNAGSQQQSNSYDQRQADLMSQGVCLLTTPTDNVAIYLMGSAARDRCQGMITSQIGGVSNWRIAQGYNGDGSQPPLVCQRDYGDQIIQVFDTGFHLLGSTVCGHLP